MAAVQYMKNNALFSVSAAMTYGSKSDEAHAFQKGTKGGGHWRNHNCSAGSTLEIF